MLEHFFDPKSIAIVGASREEGKVGNDILKNILQYGYEGRVYPINPKSDSILDTKAYPSVTAVEGDIDLAVIVVPAEFILSVIDECAEKKIEAAVIISAGFKESGVEGAERERELLKRIDEYGIRVVGPNCLGLIDTGSKLNASFAAGMPLPGNIAFFSQSGALCTAILDWAIGAEIGFSKFISIGNKTDVDETDMLLALGQDDSTDVILGYIEGVKDGAAFMGAARDVSRKKPVIIAKSGATAAGAKAASSHTGTLAGSDNAFNAAFSQCGVIRVREIQELFDYALAFSYQREVRGPNVALITNAGGPGIIAADAIEKTAARSDGRSTACGLRMSSFSKETVDGLRAALPPTANVYNPVDVIGDAKDDRYKAALEKVIADENVDAIVVILTPQAMTEIERTAEAIGEVSLEHNKTILSSFMGGPMVEQGVRTLRKYKIPNYEFPEMAVSALAAMFRQKVWSETPTEGIKRYDVDTDKVKGIFDEIRESGRCELGEQEAREVIASCGFQIPKSTLAPSETEAIVAANRIGYPIVMKIASPDILHKSDIGGVKVGINNADEVVQSFDDIVHGARRRMPDADIRGVLIQEMVTGGKEVILGMTRDPQFGPMLMFGLGGIYVEVIKDVSFRIAPIAESEANSMIREIRSYPLLRGVRGEKPVDFNIMVESLLRLSQLVTDFPEIVEMDINPLVVFSEDQGAIAIDARLTIASS